MGTNVNENELAPQQCARLHALKFEAEVLSQYPLSNCFGTKRLEEIGKIIGVRLEKTQELNFTGRLEYRAQPTIVVNANLDQVTYMERIRIICHEIGHWILRQFYPEIERVQKLEWIESYATWFALEMCLPFADRPQLNNTLSSTTEVTTITELSNYYKLPASAILKLLSRPSLGNEYRSRTNIWVGVKLSVNKFTKLDKKLRVYSVLNDRMEYYLPTNTGMTRLFNPSDWISQLPAGNVESRKTDITLFKRYPEPPYFRKITLPAMCSAFKLFPWHADYLTQTFILVRISEPVGPITN